MADRGKAGGKRGAKRASEILTVSETLHGPRHPPGSELLITALGGGTLDFPAMLAIADVLPVMIAYIDRDTRYAFVNRPLAEWLGRPRDQILGRTMREVVGEANYAAREPIVKAALAGERI